MERIGIILPKVLAKRGLKTEAEAAQVVLFANNWIKENMAETSRYLTPSHFDGEVLKVHAVHSVALTALSEREPDLLREIRAHFPGCSIRSLHIQRS